MQICYDFSPMAQQQRTSWQSVQDWYDKLVGDEGHYYHQHVVIPGVLRLLHLGKDASLLDLACGQGVLARHLPEATAYCGVDIADKLIHAAKKRDRNPNHQYVVGDASQPLPIKNKDFSHAAIILALQNIEQPEPVFMQAAQHLRPGGRFVIVINHPCYRIPRQSSWQIDEQNKLQYRRVNRYMSPLQIPIQHRGVKEETTWTFHHPLSAYCGWLKNAGLAIETMEEWCSDKESTGKAAKMENRCRKEFPLFLAIVATKPR